MSVKYLIMPNNMGMNSFEVPAAPSEGNITRKSVAGRILIGRTKTSTAKNKKLSTDPQSVAARQRRHRISDRFKTLQSLVPGAQKMDTVSMLEGAINYVKFLKAQIQLHHHLSIFIGGVLHHPVPVPGASTTDQSSLSGSAELVGKYQPINPSPDDLQPLPTASFSVAREPSSPLPMDSNFPVLEYSCVFGEDAMRDYEGYNTS